MADLPTYTDLQTKRHFFGNGQKDSFIVDTKSALDKWFKDVEDEEKFETATDATAWIYRGMTEAKYKLLTSSQRLWITNEMSQWANKSYIDFIYELVKNANKNALIEKVFSLYNYSESDRELPILSLLQHYGAPTPLMDWSYNNNVAFFFAIDGLQKKEQPRQEIENYFSVYRINKKRYKGDFLNIIDLLPSKLYPNIHSFKEFGNNGSLERIFYISDFEKRNESKI
jgi:hypothetical protein